MLKNLLVEGSGGGGKGRRFDAEKGKKQRTCEKMQVA
jgi:hypothetical protein